MSDYLFEEWKRKALSQTSENLATRIAELKNPNYPTNPTGQINLLIDEHNDENVAWTNAFTRLLGASGLPHAVVGSVEEDSYIERLKQIEQFGQTVSQTNIWDLDIFVGFSENMRVHALAHMSGCKRALFVIPDNLNPGIKNDILTRFPDQVIIADLISENTIYCKSGTVVYARCLYTINRNIEFHEKPILRHNKIVVLVHGIRTYGAWQTSIKSYLEGIGFKVHNITYGYFGLAKFLNPLRFSRRRLYNEISDEISSLVSHDCDASFFFVGHSFGTLLITRFLETVQAFKAFGIVFCGSVVRSECASSLVNNTIGDCIINDIAGKDFWPAVATSKFYGYGSVGVDGFRGRSEIKDRHHSEAGHSGFLSEEFVGQYWVPYFDGLDVVESGSPAQKPSVLKSVLMRTPLELLLLLGVGLIGIATWFFLGLYWSLAATVAILLVLILF